MAILSTSQSSLVVHSSRIESYVDTSSDSK